MDQNLLNRFSQFLSKPPHSVSAVTIKNYVADINVFIRWYEDKFRLFLPVNLTAQIIELYRKDHSDNSDSGVADTISKRTLDRHLSSLRKFCKFVVSEGIVPVNPFDQMEQSIWDKEKDVWRMREFKNFLYISQLSHLTIKNYIVDVQKFVRWSEIVTVYSKDSKTGAFALLSNELLSEYKKRLLNSNLSIPSLNRNFSSLRRFISFARKKKYIGENQVDLSKLSPLEEQKTNQTISKEYISPVQIARSSTSSGLLPIRFLLKSGTLVLWMFDFVVTNPLAFVTAKLRLFSWKLRGKPIFVNADKQVLNFAHAPSKLDQIILPKEPEFYAALDTQKKSQPMRRAFFHILVHKRPKWYKMYHSINVFHYFHFAILIVCMTALGLSLRQALFQDASQHKILALEKPSGSHSLYLKQKLADSFGNPITSSRQLRFSLYDDSISSGSSLLWQETQEVAPDANGVFTVEIGKKAFLSQNLFSSYKSLWLGITVENDPELTPRHQLSNTSLSENARFLGGLAPITEPLSGNQNVVLALDSTGNLAIGGGDTMFEATDGEFRLSGAGLLLTTNPGSNADIKLSPDGLGLIDIVKPLHNTSENNNMSNAIGSVEVDDTFSILATSSAQAALSINQTDFGPLISASASGFAKFNVSYDGTTYINGNVGIGVLVPKAALDVSGGASISGILTLSKNPLIQSSGLLDIAIGSSQSGAILFSPASSIPSVVFAKGGNVGIGTTLPFAKLAIQATANLDGVSIAGSTNPAFTLYNSSNTANKAYIGIATQDSSFSVQNAKQGDLVIRTDDSSNGAIRFAQKAGSQESFTIAPSGNIGIGVQNPTHQLQLSTDDAAKSTTTTWTVTSDARTKQDIAPFTDGLWVIEQINPVTFTYNGLANTAYGQRGIGVIAQDIQRVAPYTVKTVKTKLTPQELSDIDLLTFNPHGLFFVFINAIKELDGKISALAQSLGSAITTQMVSAKQITTDSLSVATENISVAGTSLKVYIAQLIEQAIENRDRKNEAAPNSQDITTAHIISPLADTVIVKLASSSASRFEIQNASGSAVAAFDAAGNATLAGTLISKGVETENASVSGTLHVKKLIAEEVSQTPFASSSADFTDFVKFSNGFISLGPASLTNTTVNGTLTVSKLLRIGEEDINVLGTDLQLQPLRLGGISLLSGLIRIDTDGNLNVAGNADFAKNVSVKGVLSANIISPIPSSDLVLKLGANLVAQNASGSAIFTLAQNGDLASSGSATFAKLNVNPVKPAFALSQTETQTFGSAGVATISAHQKEVTLKNDLVSERSLVYITPVGTPSAHVPFLIRQVPATSFSVGVEDEIPAETSFNWLIVN